MQGIVDRREFIVAVPWQAAAAARLVPDPATRRLRRRWVVAAVLVALLLGAIRLQDQPTKIYYYRLVGQQTLVVGTIVGPLAWMRVTSVTETPSTVTITVSSLLAPMGGSFGDLELLVKLAAPLGSRGVVDGGSGLPIPRTHCLPPSNLGPPCM